MSIDMTAVVDPKIVWDACNIDGTAMEAFELSVPADVAGCVDIYKVPPCEANPEGYWFNLSNNPYYDRAIPGCASWEMTLLAQIRFSGIPSDDHGSSNGNATVEFIHPAIKLDMDALNPNDWEALKGETKEGE